MPTTKGRAVAEKGAGAGAGEFREYALPRTGLSNLRFTGQLVAQERGKEVGEGGEGDERISRWHDLALYRTRGGKYVVAVSYRCDWEGGKEVREESRDIVEVCDDPADVERLLTREYDPTSLVVGYPAKEVFAERQRRLLLDVKNRYDAQVSRLLAGPEFDEVVE